MENLDKLPVVTNPKPKNYEIGDQVNFILGRNVYGGFVLLKYDSNLYRVNSILGQYDIPGERLFQDNTTAVKHLNKACAEMCKAYEAQITDIKSLVEFAYEHNVSTNGTPDWQAREAYRNKTAELLNVIL